MRPPIGIIAAPPSQRKSKVPHEMKPSPAGSRKLTLLSTDTALGPCNKESSNKESSKKESNLFRKRATTNWSNSADQMLEV